MSLVLPAGIGPALEKATAFLAVGSECWGLLGPVASPLRLPGCDPWLAARIEIKDKMERIAVKS